MIQPAPPGRRERLRTQARVEAKTLALQQLAEADPSAISLNAIARQMGLTGPALYRYFADRDALLAELVVDAYHDLADALEAAVHEQRDGRPANRFRAFAAAYRAWAISQPHRYRLLFGAPIPGFSAHSERIVAAAQRSMDSLLTILVDLNPAPAAPPATLWSAVRTWSRLHGVISLEIGGNFGSMGIDAARLYEAEIDELIKGPHPHPFRLAN